MRNFEVIFGLFDIDRICINILHKRVRYGNSNSNSSTRSVELEICATGEWVSQVMLGNPCSGAGSLAGLFRPRPSSCPLKCLFLSLNPRGSYFFNSFSSLFLCILSTCSIQLLLYFEILSNKGSWFVYNSFNMCSFLLWPFQMYFARFLINLN
jgi:hypothetical protein